LALVWPGRGKKTMKRAALIALLLFSVAAIAATAATGRATSESQASRCGGILWRLKTLSDPRRMAVRLAPKLTKIASIHERPYPRPIPRKRRTPFQLQTWEVVAQVTAFRQEDGQLRLILYDANAYLQAVIPTPTCLDSKTRARKEIASTWKRFVTDCGAPTREWQPSGAIVYIEGVGFWGARGVRRGSAPNGAELHPVTGFRIVAGC
jgi:hypothetical protein